MPAIIILVPKEETKAIGTIELVKYLLLFYKNQVMINMIMHWFTVVYNILLYYKYKLQEQNQFSPRLCISLNYVAPDRKYESV